MKFKAVGISAFTTLAFAMCTTAVAQKEYSPGATDTEIKIGNTAAYSGPASAYSAGAKAIKAYFDKINDEGGINGRKLSFISLDDGYNPAKTVEHTRRLVERDKVLMIVQPLGTAPVSAVHKYMNVKKVPQLFIGSGASKWGDPENFPYTMGFIPDYQTEAKLFAQYILDNKPDAKIAVFYQNDDLGKDYNKGLEIGLGDRAKDMIVARASYEQSDPTIDSQIISLKASGADTLLNASIGKFASQSIKKAAEIDWHPLQYLTNSSSSIGAVLAPAGLENAKGILSANFLRDPTDPQWQTGKEYDDYVAWLKKYNPDADIQDWLVVWGYTAAQTIVEVIKQAGDKLTHDNIMAQAANLDINLPMLLPGVNVKTAPDDYYPIERMRFMKFNGKTWELFGDVYGR